MGGFSFLHFTSLPFPSPLGNNISHFLPDICQGLGLFFNYIYIYIYILSKKYSSLFTHVLSVPSEDASTLQPLGDISPLLHFFMDGGW